MLCIILDLIMVIDLYSGIVLVMYELCYGFWVVVFGILVYYLWLIEVGFMVGGFLVFGYVFFID